MALLSAPQTYAACRNQFLLVEWVRSLGDQVLLRFCYRHSSTFRSFYLHVINLASPEVAGWIYQFLNYLWLLSSPTPISFPLSVPVCLEDRDFDSFRLTWRPSPGLVIWKLRTGSDWEGSTASGRLGFKILLRMLRFERHTFLHRALVFLNVAPRGTCTWEISFMNRNGRPRSRYR